MLISKMLLIWHTKDYILYTQYTRVAFLVYKFVCVLVLIRNNTYVRVELSARVSLS